MDQRRTIARLLRIVAELVERSSTSELEDILGGRAILEISRVPGATTPPREGRRLRDVEKRRQPGGRDLDGVIARLRLLPSREAGFALLMESQLTKRELEATARLMDLPVVREDDAEQLRRKIVEEAIGARLNSEAIRGQ
jgi:hypothetical protein